MGQTPEGKTDEEKLRHGGRTADGHQARVVFVRPVERRRRLDNGDGRREDQ